MNYHWIQHAEASVSLVPDGTESSTHLTAFFEDLLDRSPHYASVFQREGLSLAMSPGELLGRFPITERRAYRNILQLEALSLLNEERFIADYSSGSTASCVLKLCTQRDDLAEQRLTEEVFRRFGLRPSDRFLCVDVGAQEIYDFYFRAARQLGLRDCLYSQIRPPFRESIPPIASWKPSVLLTTPSLLARTWETWKHFGSDGKGPVRLLIHIGEPMPDNLAARIRQDWGCEIRSFYGTTETGGFAGECSALSGHHFQPSAVLPTLLQARKEGPESFSGELLLTTLHWRTQAVVKYRVGDRVMVDASPCSCGETTPRLSFLGRTHEAFELAGEKFRWRTFWTALRHRCPELLWLGLEIRECPEDREILDLTLVLPDSMQPSEETLLTALKEDIFEMDAMHRYGLLRSSCRFLGDEDGLRRKIPRVLDLRNTTLPPPIQGSAQWDHPGL